MAKNFWIAPKVRVLFEDVMFTVEHDGSKVQVPGLRCKWCSWTVVGCTMAEAPGHECTGAYADGDAGPTVTAL